MAQIYLEGNCWRVVLCIGEYQYSSTFECYTDAMAFVYGGLVNADAEI